MSKFRPKDKAFLNGERVTVTSVNKDRSIGTANGNLYYRVKRKGETKPFATVRSDRLQTV